jgi:hypothetical protein
MKLFKRKSNREKIVDHVFKQLEKDLRRTVPGKWRVVNVDLVTEAPVEACYRAESGQPVAYVDYGVTQRMSIDLIKVAG